MPTQTNYKQDVDTVARRDGVLRFATNKLDPIVLQVDPAEFAYYTSELVEMHLYEVTTNRLVKSAYIPLSSGLISARVYMRDQETPTQAITFEMTELIRQYFPTVKPGIYNVTANFFSNMVGSIDDQLIISTISPSRTEIVVKFPNNITPEQQLQIVEFVPPSVNKRLAQGIIEQLFDTENILDDTAKSFESLTTPDIAGALTGTTPGTQLQYIDKFSYLLSFMPDLLDRVYKQAIKYLIEQSKTDARVQQHELELFITTAIQDEVTIFVSEGNFDARIQVR